ncbi:RIP metalloprotease RseP [Candidatus Giovannonibacteria bacterium RIFCSPHIGHO2_02_43_13]|uniref:Zinc metalloprotease n=1 Tax=Candidatus Giovannonibacteria bacterium RIFCSPHIGHO2_02_43_13 TaxID=1798330 RepID=A0A1F5WRA7_9BACT|nr:MAG: Membrane-associated zinc metalloprotease [Parcubacteria group bacterium GW2011_GWA2_44_13]OGF74647.1 MAG: RIP metalloprotease RseP [Candidatus Giovannonibacteria bacterium RIFCSPHIGHO2_12_FULL_44_42]OGF78202.1 MAG: RIP metalloprotease RseP [Candidatus Giovannonibacteria bacterium RIFCSPHIGHO2_02_43_13]OGF90068.1 MAG: RIP metalloprotease RseP [Candidatus Giovannonibacteria bacterium RIFCSPLOWO2_02_FULL_43_54]OGF96609.1 MAG: RIP metalloprotease RseP [Candidatus Giovannonibacteria bacteriu
MLITLLIFFVILLVLVLSHEAGHFFSARAFGINVEEFGFGLPPRMFGIKSKKGILYSFNWLPFGGFVKITGEEGGETSDPTNFSAKPAWIRATVLASGIAMNLLLAYIVFSIITGLGTYEAIDDKDAATYPDAKVTIIQVLQNSPASEAALMEGDQILNVVSEANSLTPKNIEEVQKFIANHKGKELLLMIKRNGNEFTKIITPRKNPPEGEGPMGVALALLHIKKAQWYLTPIEGAKLTWSATAATAEGFWGLIKSAFEKEDRKDLQIAGPVGIFNLTASARSMGITTLLTFLALLSINLAIINILPIPGLDGGRLFFVIIEAIRGKRISMQASSWIHGVGLAILIILMLAITFHDLSKIF